MPDREIEARGGFPARPMICRLGEEQLEILAGAQTSRVGYGELASLRVHSHPSGKAVLGLVSRNGEKTTLRLTPSSRSDAEIASFTGALLDRVAQADPMTPLHLGPSRRQWVAAWIGLVVSCAILVAAGLTIAAASAVGPLLLPVGIALVNLGVVVPILKSGRPREQVVGKSRGAVS